MGYMKIGRVLLLLLCFLTTVYLHYELRLFCFING
jgi:hypothetical protein